jgi:enoyl-CoA hydratase/carnithine racemase
MDSETANASVDEAVLLRADDDGVTTLTLNRPKSGNSLSHALVDALHESFDAIAGDDSVRVVVLTASGRLFCTGHDLKETLSTACADDKRASNIRCSRMLEAMLDLPQPVIAKVQGTATAAGSELVASCDLAVAAEHARFATPGVNIGLWCLSPQVAVSRTIAPKHALQMLLTGDLIDTETALRFGLINEAVAADELDARVDALARQVASKSPYAVAMGKRSFYRQLELGRREAYDHVNELMVRAFNSEDSKEGIAAFLEKRPAIWRGRQRSSRP